MKINMKNWLEECKQSSSKKVMPILSFPCVQLINCNVRQLVQDSSLQVLGMKSVSERFKSDAVFGFMDLSVEAEALGSTAVFSDMEVPTVKDAVIDCMEQAENLKVPHPCFSRTNQYIQAIKNYTENMQDKPVFAGMIGPYSLAGRLLGMTEIMILCYEESELVEKVLNKATSFLTEYAKEFKKAGADGIVIAEPAAGLLSPDLMENFSNKYLEKIIKEVKDDYFAVVYHNCGNADLLVDKIKQIDADIYSFGNSVDMKFMLDNMPQDKLVMGNIDPAGVLFGSDTQTVKQKTQELLTQCGKYKNFIVSSGCDIPPMTPFENLDIFFQTVENYNKKGE